MKPGNPERRAGMGSRVPSWTLRPCRYIARRRARRSVCRSQWSEIRGFRPSNDWSEGWLAPILPVSVSRARVATGCTRRSCPLIWTATAEEGGRSRGPPCAAWLQSTSGEGRRNAIPRRRTGARPEDTSAVVLTGPNNGPVQSQSVSVTVPMNDPIEAARVYQKLMSGDG